MSLGASLAESPFEKALAAESCKGVVMILDEAATPFTRIWCLYEVQLRAFAAAGSAVSSLKLLVCLGQSLYQHVEFAASVSAGVV